MVGRPLCTAAAAQGPGLVLTWAGGGGAGWQPSPVGRPLQRRVPPSILFTPPPPPSPHPRAAVWAAHRVRPPLLPALHPLLAAEGRRRGGRGHGEGGGGRGSGGWGRQEGEEVRRRGGRSTAEAESRDASLSISPRAHPFAPRRSAQLLPARPLLGAAHLPRVPACPAPPRPAPPRPAPPRPFTSFLSARRCAPAPCAGWAATTLFPP